MQLCKEIKTRMKPFLRLANKAGLYSIEKLKQVRNLFIYKYKI